MKLRNKKTGEIGDFVFESIFNRIDLYKRECNPLTDGIWRYNSLAELNEEWEDVPVGPKEYWYIYGNQVLKNEYDGVMEDSFKEIGNYFETKEEAEKAVEKFKAWKRLKDKGFRFGGWENDIKHCLGDFIIYSEIKHLDNIIDDLDLLFGDEE